MIHSLRNKLPVILQEELLYLINFRNTMTLYIENMFFVECSPGTYGYNCSESCGECFQKEQCHHVNGSCLKGCAYGYSGVNCKKDEGMNRSMNVNSSFIFWNLRFPFWNKLISYSRL